jgi:CBS domain-containing protein
VSLRDLLLGQLGRSGAPADIATVTTPSSSSVYALLQVCREAWSAWWMDRRVDQEVTMRARELARPLPVLPLTAPAAEVARLLAAESVGVVFVQDPAGGLEGAVTDTRLLWFLLPGYLHQDPGLAGVLEEAAAETLRDRLAGRTARDLLATAHRDVPEIDGDANLVEVAALLCRTRAPVAAVRDRPGGRERERDRGGRGRLLGGITTSALLYRLLEDG